MVNNFEIVYFLDPVVNIQADLRKKVSDGEEDCSD